MNAQDDIVFLPRSTFSNRMCVVISDIHCTDGTVGNQSAEEPDWEQFFDELAHVCSMNPEHHRFDELILILNGDIVDLIRTAKWTQYGVYPWQRENSLFPQIVDEILTGIIQIHAHDNGVGGRHGFFWWLKNLRARLQPDTNVVLIPIVGNHDKELQLVPQARLRFYHECLGIEENEFSEDYQEWVAAIYGDAARSLYDAGNPLLPFYFADRDFRLFATHGQWRDKGNSRQDEHWCVREGWKPAVWRHVGYAPFMRPCFGDTVAAGLLSAFIWRTKQKLKGNSPVEQRLKRILDEMDLYRPSTAGIVRMLDESRSLANQGQYAAVTDMISTHFRECVQAWLRHGETWRSAPFPAVLFLLPLKLLASIHSERISLWMMKLMAKVGKHPNKICTRALLKLTAFLPQYRKYGFRIHTEGHTHVALEAELQFDADEIDDVNGEPLPPNYTYINSGAWRDQIVTKRNGGYRRRGNGRALFIFNSWVEEEQRQDFRYYVRDLLSWNDPYDCMEMAVHDLVHPLRKRIHQTPEDGVNKN